MNDGTIPGARPVKTGNDHFDVRAGMDVYDTRGTKIGTVVEVAGFGNTRIEEAGAMDSDGSVTQARSGTGFIKVKRETGGFTPDVVPFSRIESVVSGDRVVLLDQLAAQPSAMPRGINVATTAGRSPWFRRFLGGRKTGE